MKKNPVTIESETHSSRLRGVYIENFQSIKKPTFIEMNGLTLFYGPNSAGKSSIIDALKLLRMAFGTDDSEINNRALWMRFASRDTKIGISFIAKNLRDGCGRVDVDRWLDEEINYEKPHVHLMRRLERKLIQIEYSGSDGIIKVAVEGNPFFEIHSLPSFDYNEDLSLVTTDDEFKEADFSGRTFWGQLIVHKNRSKLAEELPAFSNLIKKIRSNQVFQIRIDKDWQSASYFSSPVTGVLVSEDENKIILNGIHIVEHLGKYSTVNVSMGLGLDDYLLPSRKERNSVDGKIRNHLHDDIENVAHEMHMTVAGLIFQAREVLDYSHVSGDRRTFSLQAPVYISDDIKFLKDVDASNVHPSIGEYAEYLVNNSAAKILNAEGKDLVSNSMGGLLRSLKGYELIANALRVRDRAERRAHFLQKEINQGLIIRLKIKTPSGKILGLDEVGSGISYILPILTSLWSSDTSLIEQPELHLHPAAQCEIGDVLIAATALGKSCVVESHSEHLLLRILRRIRETNCGLSVPDELKFNGEKLSIYYFQPDGKGSTEVIKIRVDNRGELLTEWPGGFFSERERELF